MHGAGSTFQTLPCASVSLTRSLTALPLGAHSSGSLYPAPGFICVPTPPVAFLPVLCLPGGCPCPVNYGHIPIPVSASVLARATFPFPPTAASASSSRAHPSTPPSFCSHVALYSGGWSIRSVADALSQFLADLDFMVHVAFKLWLILMWPKLLSLFGHSFSLQMLPKLRMILSTIVFKEWYGLCFPQY